METNKITFYKLAAVSAGLLILLSCDQNRNKAEIGNSQDTSSVARNGGPAIRDTASLNKDRRDSSAKPGKSTTAKGNADPSGRIKNQ